MLHVVKAATTMLGPVFGTDLPLVVDGPPDVVEFIPDQESAWVYELAVSLCKVYW
jgi:hypothetical protein